LPVVTPAVPQWASHDAGTLPWLAVAGYLVAALLCLRQFGTAASPRERLFWLLAGLVMLVLGINKQLDLQTALTAWGRQMARDGGWYGERRAFQKAFMLGALAAVAVSAAGFAWLVRGLRVPVLVAVAGLCLLGLFVLVRAASFHHIDVAMRTPVLGLKLHTVLELIGIGIVIVGAAWQQRRSAQRPG
jgi:hypothetical protein